MLVLTCGPVWDHHGGPFWQKCKMLHNGKSKKYRGYGNKVLIFSDRPGDLIARKPFDKDNPKSFKILVPEFD